MKIFVQAKIKQLEEKIYDSEDPIPEMTHNVYGLDHAKILNRLLGARRKTRDAWDSIKAEAPSITYRAEPKTSIIDIGRQKKDISEFLLQRQVCFDFITQVKFYNFFFVIFIKYFYFICINEIEVLEKLNVSCF